MKAPVQKDAAGLSYLHCTYCHGTGSRVIRSRGVWDREVTCNCVFRKAFRACLMRFRECAASAGKATSVTWEACSGTKGRRVYSRKREEFMADFCIVSRRVLDDFDHEVFRCHFLLAADWRACCNELRIDRGTVFHAIYRIEQQLGRAFAQLEPYCLWPLDQYFGGTGAFDQNPTPLIATRRNGTSRQIFPDRLGLTVHDQAPERAMAAGAGPAL